MEDTTEAVLTKKEDEERRQAIISARKVMIAGLFAGQPTSNFIDDLCGISLPFVMPQQDEE